MLSAPELALEMNAPPAVELVLAQAPGADAFTQLIPLVLILGVFYFLLIRPQQQKAREHEQMLADLAIGDRVVTNGGIYGKIVELRENDVSLEISGSPRVVVQQDRSKIAAVDKAGRKKKED
ncbi:MAG TPA: preprotein translocase subunit YajC [Candidatus Limnocylindrales bacterium]|nr:preprotein translocase subunit YajC [Candidatus Limnocylindrales bacterium]